MKRIQAKLYVHVIKRLAGKVEEDQQELTLFERDVDGPIAQVEFGLGAKKSIMYNSIEVRVGITLPCPVAKVEKAFEFAVNRVKRVFGEETENAWLAADEILSLARGEQKKD